MKVATQSNWFLSLLALLFAILLFFNANAQNNSTSATSSVQIYDEIIENVPIQLEYDKDKYFVFGYEETVTVHLSSANRMQLNLQANKDTRTFQVVADLNQSDLGTSEVQLRVKGLSSAVTAEVDPKTITTTIEKKVEKTVDVVPNLPDEIQNEGYQVEQIELDPKQVTIITGEETAKEIDKVVAPVSPVQQWSETIKQTVNVEALDSKGQILSIENPAPQVKVTIDLIMPTKEVNLSVVSTGKIPTDIEYYTFSLSEKTVEIKGSKSIIDKVETIEIPIDISNIKYVTKQKVDIPLSDDYIVNPETVEVTITPVLMSTQKTSSTLENGNTTGLSKIEKSGSQSQESTAVENTIETTTKDDTSSEE